MGSLDQNVHLSKALQNQDKEEDVEETTTDKDVQEILVEVTTMEKEKRQQTQRSQQMKMKMLKKKKKLQKKTTPILLKKIKQKHTQKTQNPFSTLVEFWTTKPKKKQITNFFLESMRV